MTRLYLLRHGESTWNPTGRYQGRIDTELSERGERQAALLAEHLKKVPLTAVYSSPLRRAFQTALGVALQHNLDVHIEPAFTEMDHGAWSGLLKEEVEKRFGPLLQLWYEHPSRVYMPGGESLAQVSQRAMTALKALLEAHPQDSTIALCSHDAVTKAILMNILGLGLDSFWKFTLENGSTTVIEFSQGQPFLVALNDTCHLRDTRSSVEAQAL